MKIKTVLTHHRNDFTATLACEHCGHEYHLLNGLDKANYHNHVIPAMQCGNCGRNRDGATVHTNPDVIAILCK